MSRSASMRHGAVDGLAHVVDGERGDRRRGQRFHLDAGLALDLDGGHDVDGGGFGDRAGNRRSTLRQGQRMAERDQLMGALGRHDAGDAGDRQHVALAGLAAEDGVEASRAAW